MVNRCERRHVDLSGWSLLTSGSELGRVLVAHSGRSLDENACKADLDPVEMSEREGSIPLDAVPLKVSKTKTRTKLIEAMTISRIRHQPCSNRGGVFDTVCIVSDMSSAINDNAFGHTRIDDRRDTRVERRLEGLTTLM